MEKNERGRIEMLVTFIEPITSEYRATFGLVFYKHRFGNAISQGRLRFTIWRAALLTRPAQVLVALFATLFVSPSIDRHVHDRIIRPVRQSRISRLRVFCCATQKRDVMKNRNFKDYEFLRLLIMKSRRYFDVEVCPKTSRDRTRSVLPWETWNEFSISEKTPGRSENGHQFS